MESSELRRRFGAHVQQLREARGLTQERLAEKIGRMVDTIGNIERGINGTRIETGYALAAALGVTMADLFNVASLPRRPTRKHRKAVQQLVELVSPHDDKTIAQLRSVVEAALRLAGPDARRRRSEKS